MATDVIMPQMGESIAEGTIVRLDQEGRRHGRSRRAAVRDLDRQGRRRDPVARRGRPREINVQEGETVAVNTVVADRSSRGEAGASQPAPARLRGPRAAAASARGRSPPAAGRAGSPSPTERRRQRRAPAPAERAPADAPVAAPAPAAGGWPVDRARCGRDEQRRRSSSPLVRKIAAEHDIDIREVQGTGDRRPGDEARHPGLHRAPKARRGARSRARAPRPRSPPPHRQPPAFGPARPSGTRSSPMSRRCAAKIAEHMVRQPAHLGARRDRVRDRLHARRRSCAMRRRRYYERRGAKLTYMPFIVKAVVDALRAFPIVNASIDGDNVVYQNDINIGIAVALDWGLIVPVIKNADEKNLLGLARAIADLADRARGRRSSSPKRCRAERSRSPTRASSARCSALPIINQPQVAILGVGAIEKRAGGHRRRDRDPADGIPGAWLRSPADRRRRRRPVHGARQAGARGVRR